MRAALIAIGSRGDLEPFLALGEELAAHGHDVSVATHGDAAPLVREAGLDYRPLPGSAAAFFAQPGVIEAMRGRPTVARLARGIGRGIGRGATAGGVAVTRAARAAKAADEDTAAEAAAQAMLIMRRYVDRAVADADVVVCGTGLRESLLTRRLDVPCAIASWYPATPTGAFPAMGAPWLPLGETYNRLTYRWAAAAEKRRLRPSLEAARRLDGAARGEVGDADAAAATRADAVPHADAVPQPDAVPHAGTVPQPDAVPHPGAASRADLPDDLSDLPVLYLQSPAVIERPADWPAHVHLTGSWRRRTPAGSDGPPEEWWRDGPAPVVVSFGSLWPVIPERWARALVEALLAAGFRVLVVGGPADAVVAPARRCTSLDFDTWLPRSHALAHHGGFGTGSSAVRAGAPQVVVPLFIDHPWWASRMRHLGVSPKPIRLRAAGVADGAPTDSRRGRRDARAGRRFARRVVRAVTRVDTPLRRRAEQLAARVRLDGGAAEAARLIERLVDAKVSS